MQNNNLLLRNNVVQKTPLSSPVASVAPNSVVTTIDNIPLEDIANKIVEGYRPFLSCNFYGTPELRYIKRPENPKPRIIIVLHYKMCSYLGDYGAGKTLKTFSLLPGEKTTITIRSYQHNEVVASKSENVLDSFSQSSANELQNSIQAETAYQNTTEMSKLNELVATFGVESTGKMSLGFVSGGVKMSNSAGFNHTTSLNETMAEQVSNLVNATNSHVSQSNSVREVEVNTNTTTTSISETEQTVTRVLENINKSRVLNFVFRQLLQEYFTITYLDDVHIVYTNGYPESQIVSSLANIDELLEQVVPDQDSRTKISNSIYSYLCNIVDYTGTKVSFIEKVDEDMGNCIDPSAETIKHSYVRKRKDLLQEYNGKTVHGIILDVTNRILRTPSVMVDALLGQGEALDCYNTKLQQAATYQADLENEKMRQAMAIISGITDPLQQAALYKKVFGDCCDVPQSGCGCIDSITKARDTETV
ncbi:MAG: hypothetical protein R2798_03800 [Chitinophagales bacterium]|nr:hypothetical protein [Bacteroidota bacterium]MCB9043106.1 hypothetical protein [Chitinophagales bacterium]